MTLAQNIRYLRKKMGLSQEDLAQKFGYKSYTTIQKWESGVSEPPFKQLKALAELFDIDMNTLVNQDLQNDSNQDKPKTLDEELEGIDFALWGEVKEMTEEQKQDVLNFAKFIKDVFIINYFPYFKYSLYMFPFFSPN